MGMYNHSTLLWIEHFRRCIPMAERNQLVLSHGGKWIVKSEGSKTVSSEHETKREAIDAARELASRNVVALRVHGKSGQTFYSSPLRGKLTDDEVRAAVRKEADAHGN
jgi:Uncharacterized protein conserved in bacteria (DUF2188)